MNSIYEYILDFICSEKGFIFFLKAAIFSVSVSLISYSQVGPFLYEKDIALHKSRVALGIANIKRDKQIKENNCDEVCRYNGDSKNIEFEQELFDSSFNVLKNTLYAGINIGLIFLVLSFFGFIHTALEYKKKTISDFVLPS